MTERRIEAALRDASDTAAVVIGAGVLGRVADLFADTLGDGRAVVVADGTTWDVAGQAVQERLAAAGRDVHEPYVFPARTAPRGTH
jgi:glycerol-1-phosphate dehydrogenase [NAD(P)+]